MTKREIELAHAALTDSIIRSFFDVYNYFGYGLLESAYLGALELDLTAKGRTVVRELHVPVYYKGAFVCWQRLDMVVDDTVVIEGKATERLPRIAARQMISYLKASRREVGLLLHFGPDPNFERFINTRPRLPGS